MIVNKMTENIWMQHGRGELPIKGRDRGTQG